jgi:hypothetical protein
MSCAGSWRIGMSAAKDIKLRARVRRLCAPAPQPPGIVNTWPTRMLSLVKPLCLRSTGTLTL